VFRHWLSWLFMMLAAVVLFPDTAQSAVKLSARGGVTVDPDQVHAGVVASVPIGLLARIQPSIEFGYGGQLYILAFNLDTVYRLPVTSDSFQAYVGGEPGAAIVYQTGATSATRTRAGLNPMGGMILRTAERPISLEARIGIGDLPGLKITAGFSF